MQVRAIVSFKPGVPDNTAAAKLAEIHGQGFEQVQGLVTGKLFLIEVKSDDPTEANRLVEEVGKVLLANGVIEEFRLDPTQK